jgi:predicted nucleotide-binding protein
MTDYSGYWAGRFAGTNMGGFEMVLRQEGANVLGDGTFNEPAIGIYKYSVAGEVAENLTLHLTPTNGNSMIRLGRVEATCTIKRDGALFGNWKSQNGTIGTFTARRETEHKNDTPNNAIFIVHGHDDAAKEKVARFIQKAGLVPIILHEQVNRGRTIIEKFEDHAAKAGFAIILATPDDCGHPSADDTKKAPRARQNVILELGYFVGKLGRDKTFVLRWPDVELPSDILGVVYHSMDSSDAWKMALAKELTAAGYQIDLNAALL